MSLKILRQSFRTTKAFFRKAGMEYSVGRRVKEAQRTADFFDFYEFQQATLQFTESLCESPESPRYQYSVSSGVDTLYASVYACMTRSILGDIESLPSVQRNCWVQYFDSFQDESDGLFYDPRLVNDIYNDSDWWGARHIALHMISAYTALGSRPRHPFRFLETYYSHSTLRKWLDCYDWNGDAIGDTDIDNKIMNIGCLLQYQRDAWNNEMAGQSVEFLKSYLREKINLTTGMWGKFDCSNSHACSRMTQFAYHLFSIFFYDNEFDFDVDRVTKIVLSTQNRYGGFGVAVNSSACEDIDSIDILIRLYPYVSPNLQVKVQSSLRKALSWVLLNQMESGGFVFRLDESFIYGSDGTSSIRNEGAALPTWFRTLSVAYMARFMKLENNFKIIDCPGYEFS